MNNKNILKDYRLFATSNCGLSPTSVDEYAKAVNRRNRKLPQSYVSPVIIEERQLNVSSIDVFSRLMMDRIIFLGSEIDNDVANIVNSQLLFLANTDDKDITIHVNSPGGSVIDGLAIVDLINYIPNDVSIVVTGLAASMASVILSCGTRGKRYALPSSEVLIHQPLGGVSGQASDIEISAKHILRLKSKLYGILSENTGQPIDKITADADRDYWMDANEALEYGIIDHILTHKED